MTDEPRPLAPGAMTLGGDPGPPRPLPAPGGGSLPPQRSLLRRRLLADRGACLGAALLLGLLLVALFAEPLAPYRPEHQHRAWAFHPPMIGRIHLFDDRGRLQRPFVAGIAVVDPQRKLYAETGERYPLRLFAPGDVYEFAGLWRGERHLLGVDGGGGLFLLGSDRFGRDILSRVLHGARLSLGVSLLGVTLAMALGVLLGGLAGYRGGVVDLLLMRGVELVLALPGLYLLLVVRDAFGRQLDPFWLYLVVVGVLAGVEWAPHARVVRGMVLAQRTLPHVDAARVLGFSGPSILLRQLLPGTASYVLVAATLAVPGFILGEAALSFLGLGVQEPAASWGGMLRDAQSVRLLVDFPWLLAPGVALALAVLACNLLGEGLRDALDLRGSR